MTPYIDFYFDFSSPYAYFASRRIDSIAQKHGRVVHWHPILLGAIFKISGQKPLTESPLLSSYASHDLARCAREHDIPYQLPDNFPVSTVAAARAYYWLSTQSEAQAQQLIHALFQAYFVDNVDISSPEAVIEVGADVGVDREALGAGLQADAIKLQLKNSVDAAIEKGVFGSPCCVVDGEQFWGNDRLDQLDKWLSTGGW